MLLFFKLSAGFFRGDYLSETKWAKKVEAAYVEKEALGRYEIDSTLYPQIEKDRAFAREKLEMGWPFQCYILREHGIVISGPDPKSLLPPVDFRHMVMSAKFIAELWNKQAQDEKESAFLYEEDKFVVITLCRFLYLLHAKKIGTKLTAVRWAKENLKKEWTDVIDQILLDKKIDKDIKFNNIIAFIKYTVDSLVNMSTTVN